MGIRYLIAAMALVIAFLVWRTAKLTENLASTKQILLEKETAISAFKSQSGKTVTEKPAAEINKSDLDKHYQDLAADLKDMRIKLNSVRAVLKASIEAKGEGTVTIVHDTVRVPGMPPVSADSLFIDDGYLSLKAGIPGRYRYLYQDSIVMAIAGKKKWLFGKETLWGSARMSNPNSRALNQTAILIQGRRDKRFYVGIGANYDP